MDELDSVVLLKVHPFCARQKTLSHYGQNNAPAKAETCHLKDHMQK